MAHNALLIKIAIIACVLLLFYSFKCTLYGQHVFVHNNRHIRTRL